MAADHGQRSTVVNVSAKKRQKTTFFSVDCAVRRNFHSVGFLKNGWIKVSKGGTVRVGPVANLPRSVGVSKKTRYVPRSEQPKSPNRGRIPRAARRRCSLNGLESRHYDGFGSAFVALGLIFVRVPRTCGWAMIWPRCPGTECNPRLSRSERNPTRTVYALTLPSRA